MAHVSSDAPDLAVAVVSTPSVWGVEDGPSIPRDFKLVYNLNRQDFMGTTERPEEAVSAALEMAQVLTRACQRTVMGAPIEPVNIGEGGAVPAISV